jgi:very-short-patch-repair endonuclease
MMEQDTLKISGMHNGAKAIIYRNAQKLRDNMTEAEQKLWEYLKSKPLGFKFRRQHPIGNYVLDFYCHKLRISIEVDGGYHLTTEQKNKDSERTACVASLGITEYRFTNEEIKVNLDKTIEIINKLLRADTPLGDGGERGNSLDKL